jgi:hypothetical protein
MPNSAPTTIEERLQAQLRALPQSVKLVAVSKFHPLEDLQQAYAAGARTFGESRADELVAKAAAMPADVEWHFIGHVQRNKARRVVSAATVIESVDSQALLELLEAEALRAGRRELQVLLQVHVAAEETKTGFTPAEMLRVAREMTPKLKAVKICGVMGMATNTDDATRIRHDFRAIAAAGEALRTIVPEATAVSMGMSHDWQIAVEEGSTQVRIGTAIFGPRG